MKLYAGSLGANIDNAHGTYFFHRTVVVMAKNETEALTLLSNAANNEYPPEKGYYAQGSDVMEITREMINKVK